MVQALFGFQKKKKSQFQGQGRLHFRCKEPDLSTDLCVSECVTVIGKVSYPHKLRAGDRPASVLNHRVSLPHVGQGLAGRNCG